MYPFLVAASIIYFVAFYRDIPQLPTWRKITRSFFWTGTMLMTGFAIMGT